MFQAASEYSKERIWRDLHRLMAVSGSDTVCAEAGCFGDLFGRSENSQRSAMSPQKWCLFEKFFLAALKPSSQLTFQRLKIFRMHGIA